MRKVFALFFIASILLSIVTLNRMNAQAQELTTIGVEPKDIVDPTLVKGQNFRVEVWVRNVANLAGVEFKLGYNTTVLNATLIEYGGIFGPTKFELASEIHDVEEYIYSDKDNSGTVTIGDDRLTAVPPYAAGSTVATDDADIGKSLVIFVGTDAPYEKHQDNVNVNNVYDPGEYIYSDKDNSGTVTIGDDRLTAVPPYAAGSTVATDDADIGMLLVTFKSTADPFEKHQENAQANAQYDPGGYLHYSVMEYFGEPGFTGHGRVANITFTVDSLGESLLELFYTTLGDDASPPNPIDHTAIDGYFANIYIHNVAVTDIAVSTNDIVVNGSVFINVTVKNEGNLNETFTVTPYYNNTVAAPFQTVADIVPRTLETLTFTWNTTGVSPSTYIISANASVVAGEIDIKDNSYTDGTITVSLGTRHDIAIVDVTPSTETVPVGQSMLIAVNVKNEGNVNETFMVTAYYNETAIGTDGITDITPGSVVVLSFIWNTTDVALGNYTIKAETSIIPDEIDPADNELVYDGFVEVVAVVHDIAITGVVASPPTILVGSSVSIKVTVRNEGNVAENFSVTAYYNTTAVTPAQTVTNLGPAESDILEFIWLTSGVAFGNYTISAEAQQVAGETDVTDNTYVDGVVAVTVHDVAVISITANPALAAAGQSVTIQVTVRNEGNYTESFSVTAKYDDSIIGEGNVFNLAQGASKTLSFPWNTTGIALGSYTISATASTISGETDTADNSYTDGTVTIKEVSTISISVDPTTLMLGDPVIINGSITPTHAEASVTIWYRRSGENDWNSLATTQTNDNGHYSHEWTPDDSGTFEVKVSWTGDANTLDDESETKTVTIQEAPEPDILWYAIAAMIIVIAVAVLVYFMKSRKPTSSKVESNVQTATDTDVLIS